MNRPSTARIVIVGVVSAVTAALVAAQPAVANGNGNGNAPGQLKKEAPTPTPPQTPPGDPGGTGTTGSDPTGIGGAAPQAAVNSFATTLAFVGTDGKRLPVQSTPVLALVTITNTSTTTNPLGSAQIATSGFTACAPTPPCNATPTPPTGFTVTYSGSTLRLQAVSPNVGVAPGASVTFRVWTRVQGSCNVANLNWPVSAWISRTLSGTSFPAGTVTPLGYLQITGQPPVATAFNVNMAPAPQVTSFNPCGIAAPPTQQVTLTDALHLLTGGTAGTSLGNVTTFSTLKFTDFDQTDTLTASAVNYTSSEPSTAFLIAEKVQPCKPGDCAPLTLNSQPQTNAVITPTVGQTDALVSGSARNPDTSLCGEGASGLTSSQISPTIAVDAPVAKTVTFTIAKALVHAISNNGTPFMNVCMRTINADGSFTDVNLPNCAVGIDACVVSRGKNRGNEIIVIRLPVGDPHFNIH